MERANAISFLSDVQKEQTEINQVFERFKHLVKATQATEEYKEGLIDRYKEHLDYLQILYARLLKFGSDVLLSQP